MQQLISINDALKGLALPDILRYLEAEFGQTAAFSTSLGIEDQLISHYIFTEAPGIRIFTLDTGRLFPETYSVLSSTRERYQKPVEVFFPEHEPLQKLITEKGPVSFYESIENRKECCGIRKVEPLSRALNGVNCWITGLRKEQSENRSEMSMVEWDEKLGLYKVHPLIDWSAEEVKAEVFRHNIPYNVLHDRGFVSIGCQPCTRAIRSGEDFRAGRWWWEDNTKKECGLHA